ncbi:MAG: M14 family zinc carboxypeptidase, partial [bacterium]
MKLLSAIRGPVLLVAAILTTSGTLSAIDRYSDPAAVNRIIGQLQQSSPALVKVHKLAVTPGGREMLILEIGSSGTAVPAVFVAANMSGTTP